MTDRPMTVFVTNPDGGEPVQRVLADDEFPAQITVFCDDCGVQVTRDYVVNELMSKYGRLQVARKTLNREGWTCDERGDYCPNCKPKPAELPSWDDGTCGDCATGKCHGTEPDDCGCDRHDASANAHLDACMECGGNHGESFHYEDRCFACGYPGCTGSCAGGSA